MRVRIAIDSANTKQTRELLAALSRLGKHESATVGLNGPDCWSATTPHLTPDEHARLVAELVKHNGRTVASELRRLGDLEREVQQREEELRAERADARRVAELMRDRDETIAALEADLELARAELRRREQLTT